MGPALRHAVWTLRLGFAAWLIPAGINHFWPLFPQPPGNQPLSREVLEALIASGLFNLVKAVELVAGVCLLVGWRAPLMLAALLPVSFNVWYWDTALQGWTSVSAIYGWAVLGANVLLCLAWIDAYRPLLSPRSARAETGRLRAGRLVLGAVLLLAAAAHFGGLLRQVAQAGTPLGLQLISALSASGLLSVAFGLLAVAGILLLAGRFVPLALAAALPVNVGAAYWSLWLEGSVAWGALALAVLALNGLLMIAHLAAYRPMLQPRPLAAGERSGGGGRYEALYADPVGGVGPAAFLAALVPLALAALFYRQLLPPIFAMWNIAVLALPLAILVLRLVQGLARPGPARA